MPVPSLSKPFSSLPFFLSSSIPPFPVANLRHIRKIPHLVPLPSSPTASPCCRPRLTLSGGPPSAALKPCASTDRVCAGGMTPSSHRRAEENTGSLSRSMRALSAGSTVLPTVAMTALSCSEPMTPMRAVGHIHKKRGEKARPLNRSEEKRLD